VDLWLPLENNVYACGVQEISFATRVVS